MYRILLVDDDNELQESNRIFFEKFGYDVLCVADGSSALSIIKKVRLDCVILDVGLEGESGFELCRKIREFTFLPIIFLSCYIEEENRVLGLMTGADDYVCKPFSPRELELRVRARIRRRHEHYPAEVYEFDGLVIDTGGRTVRFGETEADLSRLEFDVLVFLAQNPDRVYTYEQIYDSVWKEPIGCSRHTLQARMGSLRQKLSILCPDREYIHTLRRKGYMFSSHG